VVLSLKLRVSFEYILDIYLGISYLISDGKIIKSEMGEIAIYLFRLGCIPSIQISISL